MNPKAKLFLTIHKDRISIKNEKNGIKAGAEEHELSGFTRNTSRFNMGGLYFNTAIAYISETGSDESLYWHSFVYDTVSSLGKFPQSTINVTAEEIKRSIILQERDALLAINGNSYGLKELASEIDGTYKRIEPVSQKDFKNLLLTFSYNLISIDRKINACEEKFYSGFREVVQNLDGVQSRDKVYLSSSSTDKPREGILPDNHSIEAQIEEIKLLVGLENIKNEVFTLVNSLKVEKLRIEKGLPRLEVSNHMVFYGNPGTGKTTIARKLGLIYKHLGFLSKGHFVETDRSNLVAGYLGQTAIKTTEVLNSALGGILFIDEAYSLSQESSHDQFGKEAIDTMLKYMEDNRGDIVIIVAGYKNLMAEFLNANPGLKSRFNKYFEFKDYEPGELRCIFLEIANKAHYTLDESAHSHLDELSKEMYLRKRENFGNGRTVRNLFEKTVRNQANRIVSQGDPTKEELMAIRQEDIRFEDMLSVVE